MKKFKRMVKEFLALIPYFILGSIALLIIPFMFIARIGKRMRSKWRKVNWSNPEVWF